MAARPTSESFQSIVYSTDDGVSWKLFVDACRLLSICSFLVCSLSFTWYSFISLICTLGTYWRKNSFRVLLPSFKVSEVVRLSQFMCNSWFL